ncbi:hypothetical protein GCM10020358_46340 [Amorphoplanes nipponensis]|uniref:Uncharacterized protein n=1 Tax=Actinoplanes nipponensis TaxID=135950 RepID=A0A919MTD1_9ACTN|nr:hypothetical protein Ani05nite_70270 [Actinoplanes nipponensis]
MLSAAAALTHGDKAGTGGSVTTRQSGPVLGVTGGGRSDDGGAAANEVLRTITRAR